MKPHPGLALGFAAIALALAGCGKRETAHRHAGHAHDDPAHDDHAHAESARTSKPETTFKAGSGLTFPEETRQALGLATVEAEEKPVARSLRLTVQVFNNHPQVLGTASVPAPTADALEGQTLSGAKLVRIDRGAASAGGEIELILALESAHPVGAFVPVTLTVGRPEPALVIPRSALLRTTEGTFVYVASGASFLRTAVKVGRSDAERFEITDGLSPGDIVVTRPVEQLWLAELRLTKGGGHSH